MNENVQILKVSSMKLDNYVHTTVTITQDNLQNISFTLKKFFLAPF